MNLKNVLMRLLLRRRGVTWTGSSPGLFGRFFPEIQRRPGASISLGSRCAFGSDVELTAFEGAKIRIGSGVYLNHRVMVWSHQEVTIGDGALIGPGSKIIDSDMHDVSPDRRCRTGPVRIGRGAWLGMDVKVLQGVTIGDYAVIGAGAVISRDVPARAVVLGPETRVVAVVECPDGWSRP